MNNKPINQLNKTTTIKTHKKINNNYIKGAKYNMLSRKIYYKTRYNRDLRPNQQVKLILKIKCKNQLDYKIINHYIFNGTSTTRRRHKQL